MDWSLEDAGLLSIRSRGNFNRTLPTLEHGTQLFWEYLNYGLALLAGAVGGGGAPGLELPGWAVELPDWCAEALRRGEPGVVARVERAVGRWGSVAPDGEGCVHSVGAADTVRVTAEKPCYQRETFGPFEVADRHSLNEEVCLKPTKCDPQDASASDRGEDGG